MKLKLGWVLTAVIVTLAIAAFGLRIWFNSPGIRVLGNSLHANLEQKCFVIDEQSGEVLLETTVIMKGETSRKDSKLFDGDLKIIGYQNSASGTVTALKAIERTPDDNWIITHLENCTHKETDDQGVTKDVEHFCDYSYTYYVYPGAPEQLVVLIESFDSNKSMYAICAQSEEAALERYEDFLNQRNG